jgi:hypothetical protein
MLKTNLWLLLTASVAGLLMPTIVGAQPPRDQRRELVEGLLRTFLEAQIEKNLRRDRPAPPPPPPQLPPTVVKAREALTGFAREAGLLHDLLQRESVRSPAARRHLPEMMRVRTQAAVLAAESSRIYDVQTLGRELPDLDRQWRLLSYRLSQTEALRSLGEPHIRRLDDYAATLAQLCGFPPQVDHRELLRHTDSLHGDLQRLVDEIEIGLGRSREALVLQVQGRRLQQQARVLSNLAAREALREPLAAEFQRYQKQWQPFAASLWPLGHRHLERSLRSIEETDRQIHELLWLPVPINRQYLQHLTGLLMTRVDELLDRVTLRMLMEFSRVQNVPSIASEFRGVCEHFVLVVQQRGTPDELRQEYQYVIDAWPRFSACFRSARDPDLLNLLKEIEETFVALRDALRIAPEFDQRLAVQRASLLAYSAELLAAEVAHGVGKDPRYPASWRNTFVQQSKVFQQEAQQFHEALSRRHAVGELAELANQLARNWARLQREYLPEIDASRHGQLLDIANQITPTIVELQAMF